MADEIKSVLENETSKNDVTPSPDENNNPNQTEIKNTINIKEFKFKELNLFANSFYFEATVSKIYNAEQRANFINTIINQMETIYKEATITKEDLDALCFEIGMEITEENAYKARAIIGRWLTKVSFVDMYDLIQGIIKFSCIKTLSAYYFNEFIREKLALGTIESPYNIQLPACLVLCWSMIIESGVAALKGEAEKKILMPTTLERCIFIELIGHQASIADPENELRYSKSNTQCALGTIFNFFINNVTRVTKNNKQPHPSEAAYLTCAKRAFRSAGGDPFDYVYRALDNNDWNLFSFIVENNI